MPLTKEEALLEGGCNCNAIRYRVNIPPVADRPLYPVGGAEVDPPIHLPVVATDHCNDCRSATSSILPVWLMTPTAMVTISTVSVTETKQVGGRLPLDTLRGPWRPAVEVVMEEWPDQDSFVAFFASSPNRRRTFCSRCGTQITYNVYPLPEGWPFFNMIDILTGSIDREYLVKLDLQPEMQVHWALGIPWVQDFAGKAFDVPIHPSSTLSKETQIHL